MENSNSSFGGVYTRVTDDGAADAAGGFLRFGAYPRSLVRDEAQVALLNGLAGALPTNGSDHAWHSYRYYSFNENDVDFMWYQDLLHEGVRYRGVYFTDYRPNDTENTSERNNQEGNGYRPLTVYWFVWEPLLWQILDEREGKAWLLADRCIDSQAYREVVWENSYVKSSIRAWLNREFIEAAFNEREREAIGCEWIVNNMEDVDVMDGEIPGSDTHDRIHLLSVEEASERIPQGERQSTATDYARCQGIYVNPENGHSLWWLRSPYYSIDAWAQVVGTNAFFDFNTGEVGNTETGIRPALWVKL